MEKPAVQETDRAGAGPVTTVAAGALAVQPLIPVVKLGDRVMYTTPIPGAAPRVALVTKVHPKNDVGLVNLVHFAVEKGEDPVLLEESVMYQADVTWPHRWRELPK